ncbi:MAG: aa3-type cytochrome c oxidase subunit IV [Reyranellaceae bacterium]
MADATDDDLPAHVQTYESFNKLVLFTILFIVLLLSCMALGLVGNLGLLSLLIGIGGTIALLIAFAVLG